MQLRPQGFPIHADGLGFEFNAKPLQGFIELADGLLFVDALVALQAFDYGFRRIRDSGVAILMIEHIMRAVMSLSDHIVVIDLGRKLAEGSPQQVANNPDVIKAYLGDAKLMEAVEKPA